MPKFINDILCLSIEELSECGISEGTIRAGVHRNYNHWQKVEAEGYWIVFAKMKPEHQQQVIDKLGDVEQLAHRNEVEALDMMLLKYKKMHYTATDFDYFRYSLVLSEKAANGLSNTAAWVRFMASVSCKKEVVALKLPNIETKSDLVAAVHQYFKDTTKPFGLTVKDKLVSLTYLNKRVREFGKLYKEDEKTALSSLVSGKRSNNNATKLKDEEQRALLRQFLAKHQGLNYEKVKRYYNNVAKAKGWKTISRSTVESFHGRYRKQIETMRVGFSAFKGKIDYSIKRERPSEALYLVENDGTPIELYYREEKVTTDGVVLKNYWKRLVGVVVLDVYNDYPLGYALGESESSALIREAYKNAMDHVKELTGEYLQPWQIKTDNFSKNQMRNLAHKIAHYTEDRQIFATVGNARDKVIEGWFARSKEEFISHHSNFAGYNITAKGNQPNRDYLTKIVKSFPDEVGVRQQYAEFIHNCRHHVKKGEEMTLQQSWLNSLLSLDAEDKRPMSRTKYLDVFGHVTGHNNQLTKDGIEPRILGEKRHYMLFDHDFYDNLFDDYQIKYDPEDLQTVLGINRRTGELTLLASPERAPMALRDMDKDKQQKLRVQLEFKKKQRKDIIAANTRDLELISTLGDDDTIKQHLGDKLAMLNAENELKTLTKPKKAKELKPAPIPTTETPVTPDDASYKDMNFGDEYHF